MRFSALPFGRTVAQIVVRITRQALVIGHAWNTKMACFITDSNAIVDIDISGGLGLPDSVTAIVSFGRLCQIFA